MTEEMMNTKEVAGYLGIHEKQVYALIKSKRIPSTRITGKWVFPRKIIEEWIESNARDRSRRGEAEKQTNGRSAPGLRQQ